MAELNDTARVLLAACVAAIVRGEERDVDLYTALHGIDRKAILDTLIEEAAKVSVTRTIRAADPALFSARGMSSNCIVVCDIATQSGVVTELADDMLLYTVGASQYGLKRRGRATPQQVQEYRSAIRERKVNQTE